MSIDWSKRVRPTDEGASPDGQRTFSGASAEFSFTGSDGGVRHGVKYEPVDPLGLDDVVEYPHSMPSLGDEL